VVMFSRQVDSTRRDYINSAPTGQRKDLLAYVCLNSILPLAVCGRESLGEPVADTLNLAEAAGIVKQCLAKDRSLHAWVARTSMVLLDLVVENLPGSYDENLEIAMSVIGLEPGPALAPEMTAQLPPGSAERVIGLANYALSIFWVVAQPNANLQRDRSLYERLFAAPTPQTIEVSYDIIAWALVIVGRLKNARRISELPFFGREYRSVPPMPAPGWYPNPYNRGQIVDGDATFQRFWGGDDWTDRIRMRSGKQWVEQSHSMTIAPDN
jgi:hypothetical protein